MADLTTITAILSNLQIATDIARALRGADLSIERAEMKLKLADMISALAEAKIEVTEVQAALLEKEARISELEEAFQSKSKLVKRYDAYFEMDEKGEPTGEAYCAHCWQVKHKKYNLQYEPANRSVKACIACGRKYTARLVTLS